MSVILQYNEFTIEMFDDNSFSQTPDSATSYDNVYQSEKNTEYNPVSKHAIIVYRKNIKVSSAILLAVAGATSVTSDSVIIDGDNLVARCCNTVFSLTLPELKLNWMIEADWATCFSIHQYKDTYITHGELSITRIDRQGIKLWSFGGADIFVRLEEGSAFDMKDDHMELMDFNGFRYKIDYDGNIISDNVVPKPWWKFW